MWIEMLIMIHGVSVVLSRPARALWIEISAHLSLMYCSQVEAREGLVD